MVEITISRGAEGALGLDVDDANRVRRIAPHGIAARQGLLRVGDLIVAIDGVAILSSGQCVELLANGAPAYRLGVRRGGWSEASETQDIMSTPRLHELGRGKIQPLHACGTPGGGLTYVSMQGRFVDSTHGGGAKGRARSRKNLLTPGGGGGGEGELGKRVEREELEVAVRRGKTGLGIDVSETNTIVRLLPGGAAEADALLQQAAMKQQCLKAGDVVLAVDGVALGGKWLVEVMTPDATTYTFRVLRERWVDAPAAAPGAAAGGDDIHELKSWAIADLPCSPRSPSAPSAATPSAAAPAAGEQIDLGVFDMADGRTVPQWVFAQYAAMRKQASAELFSPQLGRAKAPQGSRAKSVLRPKGRAWASPADGGVEPAAAPEAAPEPAPEPAGRRAGAPTTPAPAAAPRSAPPSTFPCRPRGGGGGEGGGGAVCAPALRRAARRRPRRGRRRRAPPRRMKTKTRAASPPAASPARW